MGGISPGNWKFSFCLDRGCASGYCRTCYTRQVVLPCVHVLPILHIRVTSPPWITVRDKDIIISGNRSISVLRPHGLRIYLFMLCVWTVHFGPFLGHDFTWLILHPILAKTCITRDYEDGIPCLNNTAGCDWGGSLRHVGSLQLRLR